MAIRQAMTALKEQGRRYAIVDAVSDAHLVAIGEAAEHHALITGGSGVAMGLPANFRRAGTAGGARCGGTADACGPRRGARRFLFARDARAAWHGARAWCRCCSSIRSRSPTPRRMVATGARVDGRQAWRHADRHRCIGAAGQGGGAAADAGPRRRRRADRTDAWRMIAEDLVARGVRRLVVAGGETAGAVVSRLGVRSLRIGARDRSGRAVDLCRRRCHAAAAGAEVGQLRRTRFLHQGVRGAAMTTRMTNPSPVGGPRRQPVRARLLGRQRRQHQRAARRRLSDHADQFEPRSARSRAAVEARCGLPPCRRRQAVEGGVHASRVLSRARRMRAPWCTCTPPWRPRSPACPMSMRPIRFRR